MHMYICENEIMHSITYSNYLLVDLQPTFQALIANMDQRDRQFGNFLHPNEEDIVQSYLPVNKEEEANEINTINSHPRYL